MAERVLKVKTVSDVAEAISGLKDLEGSLRGVGTAALEASGKSKGDWKALEEQWKSSTSAAKGIADQAFKTESALNAMGRSASASQFEANLIKSKVAFDGLQAKIREVANAGGTIDDGIVASLNVMRASIDAGKAKLEELRGSAERAKAALGLTGKAAGEAAAGISKAGAAAGGAAGKMGQVGDAIRKQTEGFNKMRGAALEAWAAVGLGVQIGNAVAAAIDKFAEKQERADLAAQALAERQIRLEAAMRAVERGWIEAGKTEEETLERYTRMTVGLGRLDAASRLYIATQAQMKAPEAWGDVEQRATAMADVLTGAYKRSEEEGNRWVLANLAGIKAVLAEFDRVGKEAPAALSEFIAKAEEWAKTNEKAAASARALGEDAAGAVAGVQALGLALEGVGKESIAKSIEDVATALSQIRAEGGDVGQAARDNADALGELRDKAEGGYETLDAFRKQIMDQIPAYQATEIAMRNVGDGVDEILQKYKDWEQARRDENEESIKRGIAMEKERDAAIQLARAIDTIGEAWARATGQAAGFTVEVRRATQVIEEVDPRFTAFIESLAGVSDEFERMVPWIGAAIKELESGNMTIPEFLRLLGEMRAGFMQIQGMSGHMFGDLETLFNRLTKLVNDFLGDGRASKNPPKTPSRRR